jgi:hypothetical protein
MLTSSGGFSRNRKRRWTGEYSLAVSQLPGIGRGMALPAQFQIALPAAGDFWY